MATTRLTKGKWVAIGLDILTAEGPAAMRAEYLCRVAGTTKGSFYWHFADIEAFREEVLDHWASAAVDNARRDHTEVNGLRDAASAAAFWGDPNCAEAWAEPAIRGWAYYDMAAQNAVARTDEARFEVLRRRLARAGINNPDFATLMLAIANQNAGKGPAAEAETARVVGTLADLITALE